MHYYTLTETVPATTPPAAAPGGTPLRLDRLTIPGELDRPQLVRRIDATRLQLLEQERWAAPLDDMIRRVLTANLAARLPNRVADPNEPPGAGAHESLGVDIREFYADSGCTVTLRAVWVLQRQGTPSVRGEEEAHVPPTGHCSAPAVPETMSRALAEISDRLAVALAR
jgi:uncharacterized lipoprotein YmbA